MNLETVLGSYLIGVSCTSAVKASICLVQAIDGLYYNNPRVKKHDTIFALLPTPFDVIYSAFERQKKNTAQK
jgi:hypothetical protein